jgi:hypothetical protein
VLLSFVFSLLIAACSTPARLQRIMTFERPEAGFSVLLMPPDVELEERGLIGSKARVDWAADARQKIEATVRDILGAKNILVNVFLATDNQASEAQEAALAQQRLLFQRIAELSAYGRRAGFVIGRHPSLAPALSHLGRASDARYALFLALRDRYSSTGRVVGQVALGALFVASVVFLGMPLTPLDLGDAGPWNHGGVSAAPITSATASGSGCPDQIGYASLLDLDTGEVVWLNRVSEGCSDLRNPDDLRNTLELLLSGLA